MKRCLFAVLFLWPWPARAQLVLAGRIDRVVAAGPLVAAVRAGEVRVLAEDGRTLLRLGLSPADDGPRSARRSEDVLEQYDIPEEDRDSAYAEAVVEDESSLRERRDQRPGDEGEASRAPLLAAAASAGQLWIADGRTLWQVSAEGRARPVATLEQRFDHLAVTEERIVAALGPRLLESRDGGLTFQRLAEADGSVRALTAWGSRVAWATAAQLTVLDGTGTTTLPLARATELRACGASLLAAGPTGLLIVSPGGTTTTAGDARRIACANGTWVLVGSRLLVSTDEGRTFTARTDLPPAQLLDAAVGQRCLWLATGAGLFCLGDGAGDPPALAGPPGWLLERRDRARWAPFLPRLTVLAGATLRPGRQELRAVAYADFPLGAGSARLPPPQRLVAQVEPAEPVVPQAAPLPPDREAPCLPLARTEAVARALVEPERARSYVARAGHAAWLPELRALYARRLGRSESLDLPSGGSVAEGPLGLDTANDVRYEARATWDLSKLVFSTDEIAAVTAALRMADMRREVESLANRLYFERRRLKVEPTAATDTRARRDLRVLELEAELDALSGGAFTRCLAAPP